MFYEVKFYIMYELTQSFLIDSFRMASFSIGETDESLPFFRKITSMAWHDVKG